MTTLIIKKKSCFNVFLLVILTCVSGAIPDTQSLKKNEFEKITEIESTYSISSIVKHENNIYFSSRRGVFRIDLKSNDTLLLYKGLSSFNENRPARLASTKLVVFNNELYASFLFNGVFKFDMLNEGWIPFKSGLSDSSVFDLSICNNQLYALSYDDGLYRLNKQKKNME